MTAKRESRLLTLVFITLVLTYLVILAGAVVRTTQSGMGCPDWPKCFGKWIPPTDVSQLPENYQSIYADKGYADTTFDAYHTWVEYVNRLLGALLGLVIFIALFVGFLNRKSNPKVFGLLFISFVLIGFQGWLGSLVVASNLAPTKITIHMVTALLLLALLVYIYHVLQKNKETQFTSFAVKPWMYLVLSLTLIQVLLGTQVRQEVDVIAKSLNHLQRETWADKLSWLFKLHRTFSLVVIAVSAWVLFKALPYFFTNKKILLSIYLQIVLLGAEVFVGIILNYFAFPAAMQPAHLLLASLLFGVQVRFLLLLKN
jgi:cytochrome c oxidase assembly protein subunit 15